MKPVKTNKNNPNEGMLLVQLRIKTELNSYQAWDALEAALKNHPDLDVARAEFRVARPDEKTSIEQ